MSTVRKRMREPPSHQKLRRDRPIVTDEELAQIAEGFFGLVTTLDRLPSERDLPVVATRADGTKAILRISNADTNEEDLDFQVKALDHIHSVDPTLPIPRTARSVRGNQIEQTTTSGQVPHFVTATSFLPGDVLEDHLHLSTSALRRNLGSIMARVDLALRGFFHPAAWRAHPWSIMSAPGLKPLTRHISDPGSRQLVETILTRFENETIPLTRSMRHQVVHQDAHVGNLLVDRQQPDRIVGLIDFGDMVYAPLVAELAVAADPDHPGEVLESIADIIAGFDRVTPLEEAEIWALPDMILTRLAITLVLSAARKNHFPDEGEFLANEDAQWSYLQELVAVGQTNIQKRLAKRIQLPIRTDSDHEGNSADLRRRRAETLGSNTPHFYQEPLYVEQGEGVWLFGDDGSRYLDFYNNVPQIGHNHPSVVNAVSRQLATLNTHTRYLHTPIVDYAESLLAKLPTHIDRCSFFNSGSEANDVAIQMAKEATGRQGVIILNDAYHGITSALRPLSPSGTRHQMTPPDVEPIAVPDAFRGEFHDGDPDIATRYAADAERAVEDLTSRGFPPAAFIIDVAMCSSGVVDAPAGYFQLVSSIMQQHGVLVIADEVQSGFGRLGNMWGHAAMGLEADIVTMGKPVANGFPMGVVATSHEIQQALHQPKAVFSTFGGNPVAAAAGLAVLNVISDEGLIDRAEEVGDHLRTGLRHLMERHPSIGDVRGRGLLIGVDVVENPIDRTPGTQLAGRLVEELRQRKVLTGVDGPYQNVLKLRPPLVLATGEADFFVSALDEVLSNID